MSNPISRLLPSVTSSGQDTMSKLLPSVPDMDTQLQLAAKMIDKNTATHKVSTDRYQQLRCHFEFKATRTLWTMGL